MISLPAGSRIWLVAGITDMRNGFNGLASVVQNTLRDDPFSGHLFIFSRPARRHDKGTVGRPGRPVHVYQKAGTWPLRLAGDP